MKTALALAERKFDLIPKHGRMRRYAPIIAVDNGRITPRRTVVGKRRVKVKSCDGTRETERELARRMNWLRERIAEAS